MENSKPCIAIKDMEVAYGVGAKALNGVNLSVPEGAVVALLGANGAGKTTLLRAITSLLCFHGGRITNGSVELFGKFANQLPAHKIVRMGIAHVPEARRIFGELSVEENLRIGAITVSDSAAVAAGLARVYEMFPVLGERSGSQAGYLSGGEQQMLALGRALISSPRLIVMDEPSLGLAPLIVSQIMDSIAEISEAGTTVFLVEQNAAVALEVSDWGYILQNGRVARSGSADELLDDPQVRELYLG